MESKFKHLAILAAIYPVSVGACYLFAYWGAFGVNPLEFLTPTDLLRVAAKPLLTLGATLALGAAIGEILTGPALPSGEGRETPVGRFLNRPQVKYIVMVAYCSAVFWASIIQFELKWHVLSFLLPIPVYFYAKQAGFLIEIVENERVRSFIIYFMCVFPINAYGTGLREASDIKVGKDVYYADFDEAKWAYIGKLNEYMFFLDGERLAIRQFDRQMILSRQASKSPSK